MEELWLIIRFIFAACLMLLVIFHRPLLRWYRAKRYRRGRELQTGSEKKKSQQKPKSGGLRWGNTWLSDSAATQHFLAIGTTGSGKSQVQRLLMKEPLLEIGEREDSRAIIFDAKGDTTAYLKRIGVTAKVYSMNPFEARESMPHAVAWDVAADVTSPARALNLATSLIKQEKTGANQYFSDAARHVLTAVIESFMKHSGYDWTFSDLVHTCLSLKRVEEVLLRDDDGRDVYESFITSTGTTGFAVFSTLVTKMRYYLPIAGLWKKASRKLSVREWLADSSILLLGYNSTAKASLHALNAQIFKVLVEEIDMQTNSSTRRTWVWVDEARLSGDLIQYLPELAVKGRGRGAALVLSWQDQEGMREVAGPRLANEIVAQCSNKALLRQQSEESATFASKILGQYESIEVFRSDSSNGMSIASMNQSISEQRVVKDTVLASEFYEIPVTNPENGLTGYFVTAEEGAYHGTISSEDVGRVVVSERSERIDAIQYRPESDQWLRDWTHDDRERLSLEREPIIEQEVEGREVPKRNKKLRLRRGQQLEDLRVPNASG